jgi:D-glycero-D-manno-heptose 1,7-bisphosphate phosphatase
VTVGRSRAVFLDRDGVLNDVTLSDGRPRPPASLDDVRLLEGVSEACHRLVDAGWLLVVVTNQPDIARGATDRDRVDELNHFVTRDLPVRGVLVCPHDDADDCECRKPRPGLLLEAAERWGVDLSRSVMVGDRWRDVDAGRAAGVTTIFVDRGYDEDLRGAPDHVVPDLTGAVDLLLAVDRHEDAERDGTA